MNTQRLGGTLSLPLTSLYISGSGLRSPTHRNTRRNSFQTCDLAKGTQNNTATHQLCTTQRSRPRTGQAAWGRRPHHCSVIKPAPQREHVLHACHYRSPVGNITTPEIVCEDACFETVRTEAGHALQHQGAGPHAVDHRVHKRSARYVKPSCPAHSPREHAVSAAADTLPHSTAMQG